VIRVEHEIDALVIDVCDVRLVVRVARSGVVGAVDGVLHHLEDLLAPSAPAEELWRLARALGQVHQTLGQVEEATAWYERERQYAEEMGDVMAQVKAYFAAGELALVANNYDDAAQAANKGLSLSSSLPDEQHVSLMARGHRLLGAALAMEGSDLSTAEHHLQEAVAAHKLSDNREDLCAVLFELGNVAAQRGEIARALELYEEAAKAAEAAHVYYFQALAYNNLAYHSLLLGQLEAAQSALTRGYALAERHQMFGALLHLASTRGEILLYREEWAEAWTTFQNGLTLAEELGNLERQAGFRAGLALAARGQGRIEEAISLLEEALLARPEIASIREQVRAQQLTLRSVQGAYGPSLGANADAGRSGVAV